MTFVLQPIEPARLHDVWEQVYEHIDECRRQDPGDTWMEDVYCAIRMGQAHLYVGLEGGESVGMCLCNMLVDQFSGVQTYNIWYVNCRKGIEFLKMALPHLEAVARNYGAKRISFIANRDGFRRLSEPLGFELQEIKMVKELDNGR